MRTAGSIVLEYKASYNQRFPWSRDNSDEVKKGWIKTARSISDLATELGLPSDNLAKALRDFNDGCDTGCDQFGRKPELMRRLEGDSYYGIPIWPALFNTQGGPRRNERAQIVDVFGDAIPRLYSAGELGSIWGPLYPGAGNVCEAVVFGRIAGRNAAGETQRPL
jgi:succinate dehydrogenase/fumarate reductase flavoprotein subunit